MRLSTPSRYSSLLLPLVLLALVTSCQPTSQTIEPAPEASNSQEPEPNANPEQTSKADTDVKDKAPEDDIASPTTPIQPALKPGQYCYTANSETETTHVRFTVDTADRILGDVNGSIHNEASSYYTSYRQKLDGTIDGSNLNLDVATWIEYDQQNKQSTWKVRENELEMDGAQLSVEDCATVNKVFQNENGLEAADLTKDITIGTQAQIFFDPGKSSTTISDSVIRAYRDIYLITAQGGQQISLDISSLENNATVSLVSPSDIILGMDITQEEIVLPHTGEYTIIVGSTRGNATYDLSIEVN